MHAPSRNVHVAIRPMGGERETALSLCASSESTQQGYFPESAHCGHCDHHRKCGGKRAGNMEGPRDGDRYYLSDNRGRK